MFSKIGILLWLVIPATAQVGWQDFAAIGFSTSVGGSGVDIATAVAVDRFGNAYIAGYTDSAAIPSCSLAWRGGGVDMVVAKWNGNSHVLEYCTYIGGTRDDRAFGIAVDALGNAYITGWTTSSDFPTTLGAFQPHSAGSKDAFVAKLDSAGRLVFSTYLGGSGSDNGAAISLDQYGTVTVTGDTDSVNLPVLNPYQASLHGQADVFVARLNAAGGALIYATYLGGHGDDHATALALDGSGNAYITGNTTSMDFPTRSSFQRTSGGGQDAFVAKIGPSGGLEYSTYLGGSGGTVGFPETGAGIAVDEAGEAYVAGTTSSPDFPTTTNAFQSQRPGGGINAFVAKLNATGDRMLFGTYLGGNSVDYGLGIQVDSAGNATVAGYTASSDFPTVNAIQPSLAGSYDAFVARLNASGSSLTESTFLGGSDADSANAVAIDAMHHTYVVGQTLSRNFRLAYPTQSNPGGAVDMFITQLSAPVPVVTIDTPVAGSVLSGVTVVSGSAIDSISASRSRIATVQVQVDGIVVGNAAYGTARPDVCAGDSNGPGCPNVGFTYSLNTSALSAGAHTVTVLATDSDNTPRVGSVSVAIVVSDPRPSVHIDSPAPGAILSGTVTVAGWAIDNSISIGTAISSVRVEVDGVAWGSATYGISRSDVCAAWPGRPGCPNVGFTYQINTLSLSPGSHSLTAVATDRDGTPMSNSHTTTFQIVKPPSVTIDAPAPGATVSGTVTIAGWAIDNTSTIGTAISKVQVFVDGTLAGNATSGLSRPDVCSVWPGRPGCPSVGYAYSWDTSSLPAGLHTITVSATNSDGNPAVGSSSVTVTVSRTPPTVMIDSPNSSSHLSGIATVSGWALDNADGFATAISSVQVKVDGVLVGNAVYGINRPDVCSVYPGRPGCPNVGYTFPLNTTILTPGIHTLTISATDSDAIPSVGSATVLITVIRSTPSVCIDAPVTGARVSGIVTLAGWAIDNTSIVGTAISNVRVTVDGVAVGQAIYGTGRPDVCAAYPGRPGCPNVGFSFTWDTTGLAPGSHIVTVSATDMNGIPEVGTATITVVR